MKLEKMQSVELRDVWKHEAIDFTTWMGKSDNIVYLNEKIGLNLVDIQTEVNVGAYKCDIVAKDEFTNKVVIIENQLENTDHDHLGKVITYASGLDASVIIWIVKQARPEHSSAVEWLNKHTDEDISFFLIEAKLWKIGNSLPAFQLEIIEAPNDFSKSLKKDVRKKEPSQNELNRLSFWKLFNDVMKERKEFNVRKASMDHWYDFSIGTSRCHLVADLLNRDSRVRINMWIPNDKDMYDVFFNNKENIESELEYNLDWQRMDNKKSSRIFTYIDGFSFGNSEESHIEIANKIIDYMVQFRKTFKKYI